jgi:mannose/fructose/N-acetylgalactosamine-specific phosphotransferase system component IIC
MIAGEPVVGRQGVCESSKRDAPRWVKSSLSVGSGLLFAIGFLVGVVLRSMLLGVLLFALGAILFAIRGYLNTGDKAVAGALIFVALVAIGIEAIVYFIGP